MANKVLKIVLSAFLIFLFEKCAQVAPLTGGKRDTTPPKLVEALPANGSINFNTNQVILKFDENVKLTDLTNQLIVSPKLGFDPDIEAEGKKVIISFNKQTLLPNTTYRFYFGKAIIDMTEGNSAPNFEYIFSTGTYIDTLKVAGTIINAFNTKPESDMIIGLYNKEEDVDSLPYKKTPNYLTRSSESGEFAFSNLPKGIYKVFGFSDKNKNYMYDGETEKIAYLDSVFNLAGDSSIKLTSFNEEPAKIFIKKTNSPYYGFSQIILNKKSNLTLTTLYKADSKKIFETNVGQQKDTVSFYYKELKDSLSLILKNNSFNKIDTLEVKLPKINALKKKIGISLNTFNGKLPIHKQPVISFAGWMDTSKTDISRLKLISKKDSVTDTLDITYRWLNITTFELTNKLKQGEHYLLKADTNAFFDVSGNKNDSAKIDFQTESELELGKITLKLLFNKKQGYLVQLINAQEQVVKEKFISFSLSGSNAASIDFTDITPGTYQVKIVFDTNENKKWDTGNIHSKIQPEHVFIHPKAIKVVPDWEIEEDILIKE